jgi:serine/threonine-protein kinase
VAGTSASVSASGSSSGFITVPENAEDRRAFLQGRVALFGKMLAVISSIFLVVSGSSHFLLAAKPSLLTRLSLDRYDLAAIASFLLLWAITRRGRLPLRVLEILEAAVTVLVCAFYAIMATGANTGIDVMVPVVAALAILIGRAIFIPTTPARTLFVSVVGSIPSVVAAAIISYRLNIQTSIPRGIGPAVYAACWAGTGVAIATLASRIIYGLEQKVRTARKLGQYTLGERIGEGGMGAVYLASHAMLRRPTAVKVLPPEKMGEQNILRFEREVQLTSQLTHPNTICIYDYGRTPDGLFYYAMEYLDGFTLTELVEATGALPAARIAWLLRQVAGSLAEAHRIDLIHRDIKPDNIIVCERGGSYDVVKVLDFGLVKDFRSTDPALSQVNAAVGTPLFMSPEAFTTPGKVGASSDIYALGAVAYYLATGRHVFEGGSLWEVTARHVTMPPDPLPRDVPEALSKLVLQCLAKKPEDRPRGASELEKSFVAMQGGWSQDDAEAWWRDHRETVARLRPTRSRVPPATPEILRTVTPAEPLAPTLAALERHA